MQNILTCLLAAGKLHDLTQGLYVGHLHRDKISLSLAVWIARRSVVAGISNQDRHNGICRSDVDIVVEISGFWSQLTGLDWTTRQLDLPSSEAARMHNERRVMLSCDVYKLKIQNSLLDVASVAVVVLTSCANTNIMNFVLGSMELALVAVTGLVRQNYGVVLHLLTVPMSPGCYTEASEYCTKAPDYCSTTYAALSYYTESPLYYSSPSYTTKGSITTPMLRSNGVILQPTYAAPAHYTEASQHYTTKALEYYTTTYHAYYTEALKCYSIKAPDYYTTAHVASSYYDECPKVEYYVEAPKFYITKAPEYKNGRILHRSNHGTLWRCAIVNVATVMSGSTTGVPISPGYGGLEHSATTGYYNEALKCYTTKARKHYTTTDAALM
ncbi:hypothetical protein DAPPUDRAFT_234432 [Daphnia pulex]|uniref:Uncharacterized protein n=1 Tax=Daphnia pulex TaxID=6669 RepID=E9FWL4_DAPPU|nr:hypothetical protein DAPPUDRAFT_234432 [Daphnia pulex]|eukprot:EFX87915.1 hypothetical protein DAPPUDRAFT_234432 [Daphnia pulex]